MSAELLTFPLELARPPERVLRAIAEARSATGRHELIAELLLAIEAAPLVPLTCYPVRLADGTAHVAAIVGPRVLRLPPDAARDAADALFAEQAYPACIADAAALRDAAELCEPRIEVWPPRHGRTGMVTTLALAGLILGAALLSHGGGL